MLKKGGRGGQGGRGIKNSSKFHFIFNFFMSVYFYGIFQLFDRITYQINLQDLTNISL